MNRNLMLEDRDRSQSTPAPPAEGARAEVVPAGDVTGRREATPAAVFPAPLTTISAAVMGGLIGLGAVYGVAARLADTLVGVAVIVLVFALSMAGPRVHAVARSEVGRTVAVVLEAIAFGGVLGAVIVLF
ncbi:hypothetical protein [Dietzia psychralcaliphila]|uniref:Uncharacterized protein n=1 Tax=Dietzia psychralcaliphila TaxID=139021 RepID=A0AAD0NPS1_9ACTN|nr:hypothetical protein [Dietzia psychralcaliphila]AWH94243.1 hypothetical protein A6048_00510 [Dietzia psychralcaliphila]PTM87840.1 hypothetical protein C8N39_10455 [Dietzia psychralcaliphila]